MAVEVHRTEQMREERRARVKQKMVNKMLKGALRCSFDGWRKVVSSSRSFEMKEMLHILKSQRHQLSSSTIYHLLFRISRSFEMKEMRRAARHRLARSEKS